ncbi:hypothetical protein DM02DRAFT_89883 [Periconia macrospinosa]|uniref:Uncharacterized protein n=1 Tax=Periconia macrospinosa TaxID=97972 RepID=A0A2V1DJA2_9PLEO|nr:hypothetical protein DM02DRAFT_89883 [Periconia macrospinosa]
MSSAAPPLSPSLHPQSEDRQMNRLRYHGPFVPYHLIKARSASSVRNDTTFVTKRVRDYIESFQIPKSTLEELDHVLRAPSKGKEMQYDPLHTLFRAIHDDSHSLVEIIRISLQRIGEDTLDENLMQRRVTFWRGLLHRLNFNLGELDQNLRAFLHFTTGPEMHTSREVLPSMKLARETQETLRDCMALIDRSSHSLLTQMQMVDSRRSIAEAESVSKLTELAFIFIPLSFVASLFSMQVHELDGGVPLYRFVLVAVAFVIVAYAMRLSIRSARLVEYKNDLFEQIREETDLQHNESIPTHKFIGWIASAAIVSASSNASSFVAVFAPFTLAAAVLAAIVSPIVLLWLRNIDRGFTAVMTVLLLLLDMVLVVPIVLNNSDHLKFNPRQQILQIQRTHRMNKQKREKAKRRRRRKAGADPENAGSESEESSDS